MDEQNEPNTTSVSTFAPLSFHESIGMYADSSRAAEWFERLRNYLNHQKIPITTASSIVKQLLPSRDRSKVDLAHDECNTINEFVNGLKRRLMRRTNVVKRTKSALEGRIRRPEEPLHDHLLLIKADLKAAFPQLDEDKLIVLSQYECWKNLPDEIASRAELKSSQTVYDWCDLVDKMFENPPAAVSSDPHFRPMVEVHTVNLPAQDLTNKVEKQTKELDEIKKQLKEISDRLTTTSNSSEPSGFQCNCGNPAVRLTCLRPGPNNGRPFFTCSAPRNTGCNFFTWEDYNSRRPQRPNGGNWRRQNNNRHRNPHNNNYSGNGNAR